MISSISDAGKPTDIWSLGALAYELISGDKPFGTGLKAVPAILAGKVPALKKSLHQQHQFKTIANDIYELILKCLSVDVEKRIDADSLVESCEKLCYPTTERELGVIKKFDNSYWGFIEPAAGKSVFFHVESVFGTQKLKVGDRVFFARHPGGGSDRAFPVVKIS